jgi:ankyrin repeat protein
MEFSPQLSSQLTGANSNKIPIAQYIQQNKWKKVIKLLRSKDGPEIMAKRNCSGLSLLAFAISHKPPLNVVETMLKVNPSLVHQADTNGHLPLHIACATGCSSELINVLLEQDGKDAVSKPATFNHRFPLHYNCIYILNPHWYENSKILSDRSMQTDDEPSINKSYHKKNTIRRSRSHQEEFSLKSKESKSKRSHPPESFSGATIMTLKYEEFEDQLLVLRKLISIDPHVLNARDKYGYAPIDYFQDFVAENNEISPRWERCDIIRYVMIAYGLFG